MERIVPQMRMLSTPEVRRAERVLTVSYLQVLVGVVVITDETKTVCANRDGCVQAHAAGRTESSDRGSCAVRV